MREAPSSIPPKARLLFIAHRIPFPPNKGDKIRSFHELRFLSRFFDIDLVCFAGRDADEQALLRYCASVHLFARPLWRLVWGLLRAFIPGAAASVELYRSKPLRKRVAGLFALHRYRAVFVFSGQMAQYLEGYSISPVIDFCDVDSYKWRNYAERLPFYLAWFYRREARNLLAFEKRHALRAEAAIFITPSELQLFRDLGGAGPLRVLPNGVDKEYFRPGDGPREEGRILFTGAMDYFPNEDAVLWFAREVFPALRTRFPRARFVVAGSRPTPRIRALARFDNIEVTGYVDDMRHEQARAHVVVIPLRIARGMQNKALEALACGKAVVSSPKALGGIPAEDGRHLLVAESAGQWIDSVSRVLQDAELARSLGVEARRFIDTRFDWDGLLEAGLLPLLCPPSQSELAAPIGK